MITSSSLCTRIGRLSLLMLLSGVTLVHANPAPRIVADEPNFNFGTQPNTETIEHTFTIRNDGDASLEIARVRSSCGCTVGKVSSTLLAPGESAEITGRFNLRGRSGPQRSTLTVESNDPQQPRYRLTMNGVAQRANVEIRPSTLLFGALKAGATANRTIEVVGVAGDGFDLTEVRLESDPFSAGEPEQLAPHHYRIPVQFTAAGDAGERQAIVTVLTSHPSFGQLSGLLRGAVIDQIPYGPSTIELDAAATQAVTRYIMVRQGNVPPFDIERVEVPENTAEVQVFTIANLGYRIQISNLLPDPAWNEQPIRIFTTSSITPVIEVPVQLVAAP
jgi:hypothetical protein